MHRSSRRGRLLTTSEISGRIPPFLRQATKQVCKKGPQQERSEAHNMSCEEYRKFLYQFYPVLSYSIFSEMICDPLRPHRCCTSREPTGARIGGTPSTGEGDAVPQEYQEAATRGVERWMERVVAGRCFGERCFGCPSLLTASEGMEKQIGIFGQSRKQEDQQTRQSPFKIARIELLSAGVGL